MCMNFCWPTTVESGLQAVCHLSVRVDISRSHNPSIDFFSYFTHDDISALIGGMRQIWNWGGPVKFVVDITIL